MVAGSGLAETAPKKVAAREALCWVWGGLSVIIGLGTAISADGWINEVVRGLGVSAGGAVLLPPLLARLRSRVAWTKPAAFPIIVAILTPILSVAISWPFLPSPQKRSELRAAAIARAERALSAGDVGQARFVVVRARAHGLGDDQLEALYWKIDAAGAAARPGSRPAPASAKPVVNEPTETAQEAFVDRTQHYYLAQVAAISTTVPADTDAFHDRLNSLEMAQQSYAEGTAYILTKDQARVRDQFRSALSAKQAKLYPILRRAYGEVLSQALFRQDIRVSIVGPNASTLHLEGPMFVHNANIADVEEGLEEQAKTVRFRRVEYRWDNYFSGTTSYALKGPSDSDTD